ncbi:hypothetical protein CK203_032965 [Vitis vinifera]|uniref:DUF4220 domain-containing protein n=1 Tax=Vitis vinifera TaxID=29760 RepID=A0A438HVX9_VITVI|nr:hypothetical protein CK203_032965 [Vitis vinifera]
MTQFQKHSPQHLRSSFPSLQPSATLFDYRDEFHFRETMLSTGVSSMILVNRRRLMPILPSSLMKLWNKWELRVMVLLSLSLQILLIILGNRRKYTAKSWVGVIIWLAYLSADWVATVSIGILMNQEDCEDKSPATNYVIMAFWAPFLLFGGAFYVFLKSWEGEELNFLAIPVFIIGLIKYGERTWILRSASSDHFRDAMLPRPDPGPNYAKFMDVYSLKKAEGYNVSLCPGIETSKLVNHSPPAAINSIVPDAAILQAAYYFFNNFKRLFADLILSFQDRQDSQSFFQSTSWEEVFRVIETELGFIIDTGRYSTTDVIITYSLLAGGIVIEMYAIAVLLSSDWTELWLSKHKNPFLNLLYRTFFTRRLCFQLPYVLPAKNRWSDSMAQHNLISICLKEKPIRCSGVQKFLGIYEALQGHQCKNSKVSPDLKRLIFEILQEKSRGASDIEACKRICSQRGDNVLEKMNCLPKFDWSIIKVEFDQSILLWHIATDLCYYADLNKNPNSVESSQCKASKLLSDYMLYLLVMCPFMLPNGIGKIRFQDSCAEATEFFQERNYITSRSQACTTLLQVNTEILPLEVKGDRSKSVLFDACRLAKCLQSLETEEQWQCEQKWEMMSHVWVEMLSHAAGQCQWNHMPSSSGRRRAAHSCLASDGSFLE